MRERFRDRKLLKRYWICVTYFSCFFVRCNYFREDHDCNGGGGGGGVDDSSSSIYYLLVSCVRTDCSTKSPDTENVLLLLRTRQRIKIKLKIACDRGENVMFVATRAIAGDDTALGTYKYYTTRVRRPCRYRSSEWSRNLINNNKHNIIHYN